MTCNVAQYLPRNDGIVQEIEDIVHAPGKVAYPARLPAAIGRRRRFRPSANIKISVIAPAVPELKVIGYQNRRSDVYIDLIDERNDRILRKFHTHEFHYNPGGVLVPGTHMHFPSVNYPLARDGSSYAYGLDDDIETLAEGVLAFCHLLGISTYNIQDLLGD